MKSALYWQIVRERAAAMGSDGCTVVPEIYRDACLAHDIAYRTGCNVFGDPRTRTEADREFRHDMQAMSPLGKVSPMSWWRWAGVRLFGWRSWKACDAS